MEEPVVFLNTEELSLTKYLAFNVACGIIQVSLLQHIIQVVRRCLEISKGKAG
jgi:hypothetical protein